MNCPNCGQSAAEPATECQSCGVVFAKWNARAATPAASPAAAESKGVGLGAILLIGLGLGAAFWLHRARQQPAPPQPVAVAAQAAPAAPAVMSYNPGAAIVNMGSNIQKAENAARLQTQSQNRTSAEVSRTIAEP